jgi:hypothetical protein
MNVKLLNIIADESSGNIKAGAVVACRRAGDAEWSDPWGGQFDEHEQAQFNDLACGECDYVHLSGDRAFAAHLAAKF